ncbi:unnamed protein product [Durusdinium trenchii]|uniref:F-BAR domain-containing protein n=1 Tax=Durusdinium trenchii TaxID=1381693 RepID=A0ABP0QUM0_9DINO
MLRQVPVEKVDPKEETTTSLPQERLVPAPELTSGAEWPWKKVGGSPAAESTNVEVVEGPLTFQKALWDRFDFVWKQRVEPSQGQLQKLCDVLKARADLERKYGESLLGLGETFNPEPGQRALEGQKVNFRNRGEQSIALADELEQDIIVSFECVIKQHNEVSKRIYSDVQLLLKHLQDKKKAHDKSARRYGSRCVEAESTSQDCLQAVSMKTPERLKLAQQATILSKQARVAEYDYYHAIDQVPVNIDPSHLAAMPTLRLELGSPLLMTALNWLKEEGLVLDEEKLESFELIGWNSLQLDLFVEDVTKKQELRLHDFQDPHHPARHRVQVDLGDELDAQMVDDLLLALQSDTAVTELHLGADEQGALWPRLDRLATSSLHVLELRGRVPKEVPGSLAQLLQSESLQSLRLPGIGLGCKGAALLAVGLRQNDFLLDLDLRRNAGLPG